MSGLSRNRGTVELQAQTQSVGQNKYFQSSLFGYIPDLGPKMTSYQDDNYKVSAIQVEKKRKSLQQNSP